MYKPAKCAETFTYICTQIVPDPTGIGVPDLCSYASATGASNFDLNTGVVTFESEVYDELTDTYFELEISTT